MSYPGQHFDEIARQLVFPSDYENPSPKSRYHLTVIGAGPAGLVAAISAAGLGARVALVEAQAMGGDCLNVGCVPSKALLESTKNQSITFDDAFSWLRQVRAGISQHDSVERYSQSGVDVFLGRAVFDGLGNVSVAGQPIRSRRVAICVGSRTTLPPIPGLAESGPLTNETIFDLTVQPTSMAILGAGPIGCELATVLSRLGTRVHLFDLADRVLPSEVESASREVQEALSQLGVELHLGCEIEEVSVSSKGKRVKTGEGEYETEEVLVALGRTPNTDLLNLESVGVQTDELGSIIVDKKLRTTNRRFYAAGDCTQEGNYTHQADLHARVLVQNSLFIPSASVKDAIIPHCTYTSPEVASIGTSPERLRAAGVEHDLYRVEFSDLDRARVRNDSTGFALIATPKGKDKILFATVVGEGAGEQISLISLLMNNGLGLSQAGKAVFSYPTYSEYLKKLSDSYNRTRLTPRAQSLLKRWLRWCE